MSTNAAENLGLSVFFLPYAQLAADHTGVSVCPVRVAHRPPLAIQVNFYPSTARQWPTNQTDCTWKPKQSGVNSAGTEPLTQTQPKAWTCLGGSRSKPSRWRPSSAWRSTMDWTRGLGSCRSCGPPGPGPGTAWHSPGTRSTSDRGRRSRSGTRCRCNIPARWTPQSRREALQHRGRRREGMRKRKRRELDVLDEMRLRRRRVNPIIPHVCISSEHKTPTWPIHLLCPGSGLMYSPWLIHTEKDIKPDLMLLGGDQLPRITFSEREECRSEAQAG